MNNPDLTSELEPQSTEYDDASENDSPEKASRLSLTSENEDMSDSMSSI